MMMRFICFLCICFWANIANGAPVDNEWLALGHYRPQIFGGYKSTIDTDNFFLSPKGKISPQDELQATIDLFSNNQNEDKKCLFPARYKYLQQKGYALKSFPKCEKLEEFYADLQPAGVTLLFTDAYMNNPSSLFGHTLLRIDTKRKGTQLLAHGANYGAFTNGKENSALFAILGLTGGYYGGFTVKPYYDVINTYNNLENRDIWELNLDFSPKELDFFVAHLWEIGHVQSRYYFFSRNCSYMLMEMLDAVRPSLKLADDFPVQAIPLDTLKAVYSRQGLVKEIYYRPSRQAKIKYRYNQMSETERAAYIEAIKNQKYEMSNLSEEERSNVLETAYQYVQYQYVAKDLELKDYRKRSFDLLKARSNQNEQGKIKELRSGASPLDTHEAMRATIGTGMKNGQSFQEISYRPAYHSLTDNNYGFLRGAEINFLNTIVRHYDNSNKTVLQELDMVGIKSISPMDEMFKPISYAIDAKIERMMMPDDEDEGYVFKLKVGGGVSYALSDKIWTYAMINNYAVYGGSLARNQYMAVGGMLGVFADFGNWRLLAETEKIWATQKSGSTIRYKIESAYSLSKNTALAAEYLYQQNYGHDVDEFVLSGRFYF
ncbi:MAG: DUF4105 domain-containing protein [Alphaproteobacteria bacterium]|nr:DUF4105 domain-containing protein [Alphaproteobacteria bacterium]